MHDNEQHGANAHSISSTNDETEDGDDIGK
jgi:hypothetical protein